MTESTLIGECTCASQEDDTQGLSDELLIVIDSAMGHGCASSSQSMNMRKPVPDKKQCYHLEGMDAISSTTVHPGLFTLNG